MTDITEEFINEMREKLNPDVSLSLDENVLNPNPISQWQTDLFVGHKNERSVLSNGLISCIKGFYKKIVMHGIRGIGKTSLSTLAIVAAKDHSLNYRCFGFSKVNYVNTFDAFYFSLLMDLFYEPIYSLADFGNKKEDERDANAAEMKQKVKKREPYTKIINKIMSDKVKTIKELFDLPEVKQVIKKENENESLASLQNKLLESFITEVAKRKICIIFDDFEMLLDDVENRLFLQEIKNLMKAKDVFSLIVMYTETFKKLEGEHDELIVKDVFPLEVLPFTRGELRDLIRRRIGFYGSHHIKNFPQPPTAAELAPFSEIAVDMIADAANGNPLLFIRKLKEAITLANEKGVSSVTEDLASIIVSSGAIMPQNLTMGQKQVMDYIKTKREVTIQDVTNFQGKSRIAAFFILKSLYNIGILDKKRHGREMLYFIKNPTLIR